MSFSYIPRATRAAFNFRSRSPVILTSLRIGFSAFSRRAAFLLLAVAAGSFGCLAFCFFVLPGQLKLSCGAIQAFFAVLDTLNCRATTETGLSRIPLLVAITSK
jgi:hypothetical protein